MAMAVVVDQAEDELSLPASIRSTDDGFYIRQIHEAFQDVQLLFGADMGFIFPLSRDDGQVFRSPGFIGFILGMGRCQLDQMADAPADKILRAGQISVLPFLGTDNRSNSMCHTGLFGDYKGLHVLKILSFEVDLIISGNQTGCFKVF